MTRPETKASAPWFSRMVAGLALLGLAGCTSPGGDRGGKQIVTLYMVTTPVALNLDDHPGVDGIGVNLFAFGAGPKAVPLPPGTVEFTAYDSVGILANPPQAFRVWTFQVADLRSHRTKAAIGEGYRFLLSWSPKLLISDRLAVVCRFQPETGPAVVSEPGVIAVVGDPGR